MTLFAAIARYGLFAIGIGSGIEGEPFAIAGGVLARLGGMPLWQPLGAAVAGSWLIDQFWFLLSRHFRDHRWVRAVAARPGFARALAAIDDHPRWFILLFRFAYGLRAVAPVAIGASRVPYRLFFALNIVAAALWGSIFTLVGYAFGPPIRHWFDHATKGEMLVAGLLLVLISAGMLAFTLRKRPNLR